jgi:small-conductance mechanosensitive channel
MKKTKQLEPRIPLIVRRLAGSVTVLVVVLVAVWLLSTLRISTVDTAGHPYGPLVIGIAVALVTIRLLDYLLFDIVFRLRRGAPAPALLRQLIGLLAFGVALAIVFKMFLPGVNLGGLLVSSAIITAVIGLALQDTLGNLFAGLALHLEKTVEVGDLIRTGETFGIVEELSWRAIKLHTMEGNPLLIPNSVAGREKLEIFPRTGRPIARTLRIGVDSEASPAATRAVLEESLRGTTGIATEPKLAAYLKSFDAYANTYEVRYFLVDYKRYIEVDSAARERTWYALHRAGIKIAYPIIEQHQYAAGPLLRPSRKDAIEPVIGRVDLFATLTAAELVQLASGAAERRFGPDEIIVREGDSTSSMFVIEAGRAAVTIHGASGDSRGITLLDPGAAFGEISLLTGVPRTATVRALTEVVAIEITKDTLLPVLEDNPDLCETFDSVIEERRRHASALFEATREELERTPAGPITALIARFFGLKR